MTDLPTFREIAEQRLADAASRDKTINLKISIPTARMMVERENTEAEMLSWIFSHCELRDGDGVHVDQDDVRSAVLNL